MTCVLVVEDEPIVRMDAAVTLEDEGFDVIEAATAQVALSTLEQIDGNVDALFTDVDMPGGLDGLELAEIVSSRWPRVALVVTSAVVRASAEMPDHGVFMEKPYTSSAPVQVIKDQIAQKQRG